MCDLLTRSLQKQLRLLNLLTKQQIIWRSFHEVVGDVIVPSRLQGIEHLREPRLNKGLAHTIEERQLLGIHGLQPPCYRTQAEQLEVCLRSVRNLRQSINKYTYLVDLHDRNEKLFFQLLSENISELMPIVYTPTVGLACQNFGILYRRPRGLFITIKDKGHCFDVLKNWPEYDVQAICVTDGERILGLGDLGAHGMGISIGKLALYTALGGIHPHKCLPIALDVGTNNEELLTSEHYVGLKQKRASGQIYDEFLEEFMQACIKRYSQNVLIQFEDFGNANAFKLLEKYKQRYCTFNDDIQGTAAVTLAGLYASKRITKKKMSDHKILFLGAGEAALGIADLVCKAMHEDYITLEEARRKIWMMDLGGLLVKSRTDIANDHRIKYAQHHEPTNDLEKLVKEIQPSILIGASAAGGAFTAEILRAMGSFNERPIIMALSNPTTKAECTAQDAYDNTEGRVLFTSGSPFAPVEYRGQIFKTGQGNNAYIFPGVALGVITGGIYHIRSEVFLLAAKTVADSVTDENLQNGSLYPPLNSIREISVQIAVKILQYAYKEGVASIYPQPKEKEKYIRSTLYTYTYDPSVPTTWPWGNQK